MKREFYRNKNVVVYGASGGLGEALCVEMCGKVAQLVLAGRSAEKLEALKQRLKPLCGEITVLKVWAFSDPMAGFAVWTQQNGMDGLIVTTGKTLYQKFCKECCEQIMEQDWQDYEELLNVNLTSVLQLVMALLPYFRRRQGFFHITGSYTCLFPVPYQAVYSASKAALLSFVQAVTKEQEAEFGRANVRGLLSISLLGGMATNMYYQSDLQKQFAGFEKLVVADPQKIAVSLLKGIAQKKQIITVKLTGFLVYHLIRRLPAEWLSYALLWAYRPKE